MSRVNFFIFISFLEDYQEVHAEARLLAGTRFELEVHHDK